MSFKLTILGCSAAVPDLDKHPSSQLLNSNENLFLIDCGEGTQIRLRERNINFQRISHVLISHLHGDHFYGLIGLINSMHLLGRKKELHIFSHFELKNIILQTDFKYDNIKNFYYFPSGRWDIEMTSGVIIKLPITRIKESLNLSIDLLNNKEFSNKKILDIRQKNQIVIND